MLTTFLTHGCGALNVDGCRIEAGTEHHRPHQPTNHDRGVYASQSAFQPTNAEGGRWPSNVLIDDSPEVVGCFPDEEIARFYYCAKASRAEREAGCWDVPPMKREDVTGRKEGSAGQKHARAGITSRGDIHNSHPTVKPIALMRYLLRLITQPERNLILDPFAGSGTTGIACALAGIPCVLIEQDPHHVEIIKARIQWATDIRQRLGREPDLDLTPYQTKTEPKDDNQGSLF